MERVASQAGLLPMSEETRGHSLKQRRLDLGVASQRKMEALAEEHHFDLSRAAIMAAEKGEAGESTYERYDALLRRLVKGPVGDRELIPISRETALEAVRAAAEAVGETHLLDDRR